MSKQALERRLFERALSAIPSLPDRPMSGGDGARPGPFEDQLEQGTGIESRQCLSQPLGAVRGDVGRRPVRSRGAEA